MAAPGRQRKLALVISVIGHVLLALLLIVRIPFSVNQQAAGLNVIPIETVMIDEAAIDAQMAMLEAREQAELERQRVAEQEARDRQAALEREAQAAEAARQREIAELERVRRERETAEVEAEAARVRLATQQREEEERIARIEQERIAAEQKAAEEQRQREAEAAARRAEEERVAREQAAAAQRAEEERLARERAEAERRRRAEAEVAAAMAAEQASRDAANSGLRDQWALAISRRIEQRWIRPPNVTTALECLLIVTQLPDGSVTNVRVEQCNTRDETIIRSLENAVLQSSPLPPRPTGVAFESTIRIRFKPTE